MPRGRTKIKPATYSTEKLDQWYEIILATIQFLPKTVNTVRGKRFKSPVLRVHVVQL